MKRKDGRLTVMTYDIAMGAGQDAGNRSMRRAGRTAWSEDDYNVAVEEFNRLWPEKNDKNPPKESKP